MSFIERDFHFSGLFRVEVEGLDIGLFQEVTIPDMEVATVEYNHGGSKSPKKRPGVVKWTNLKLKRGYSTNRILQEWVENIAKGMSDRRSISVVALDEEEKETMRWNMFDCWPCKWNHSALAGSKNEVSTEQLEIVLERMERAA